MPASWEQVHGLMAEVGAVLDLAEVTELPDHDYWRVVGADETGIDLDFERTTGKLVISTSLGRPRAQGREALYDTLLAYNGAWRETGGARLALDEPGGEVVLLFDLDAEGLDVSASAACWRTSRRSRPSGAGSWRASWAPRRGTTAPTPRRRLCRASYRRASSGADAAGRGRERKAFRAGHQRHDVPADQDAVRRRGRVRQRPGGQEPAPEHRVRAARPPRRQEQRHSLYEAGREARDAVDTIKRSIDNELGPGAGATVFKNLNIKGKVSVGDMTAIKGEVDRLATLRPVLPARGFELAPCAATRRCGRQLRAHDGHRRRGRVQAEARHNLKAVRQGCRRVARRHGAVREGLQPHEHPPRRRRESVDVPTGAGMRRRHVKPSPTSPATTRRRRGPSRTS
jgi:hypothetical protein